MMFFWICASICVWILLIILTFSMILFGETESSGWFVDLFDTPSIFAICLIGFPYAMLIALIVSKIRYRKRIKKRKPLYPQHSDAYWDDFRDKIDDRMGYHPDFKDKVKDRMG